MQCWALCVLGRANQAAPLDVVSGFQMEKDVWYCLVWNSLRPPSGDLPASAVGTLGYQAVLPIFPDSDPPQSGLGKTEIAFISEVRENINFSPLLLFPTPPPCL